MAKILIVDDDPDVVQAGKLVLEKAGYQVSSALSKDEGMAAVRSFKPDLLILDVMMQLPDDGISMAQKLRRDGFEKPILMLTNVGRASGLAIGKDAELVPVDEYQEKPIKPDVLVMKVGELLGRK